MKNDNKKSIIIVVSILAAILVLFAFIRGCDKKEKDVKKKPKDDVIEKITEDNDIDEVDEYYIPTETVKVTPVVAPAVKKEQILTLTLNGEDLIYVDYGSTFVDVDGAFASDTVDGNITNNIIKNIYKITINPTDGSTVRTWVNNVDTNDRNETYEIEYKVTNSKGETKIVTRTVVIRDVIEELQLDLVGDRYPAPYEMGKYVEAGYSAHQVVNGSDLPVDVNVTYTFINPDASETPADSSMSTVGTYRIDYTATGFDGTTKPDFRIVVITADVTPPTINAEDSYQFVTNQPIDLDSIVYDVDDNDPSFDPTATGAVTYTIMNGGIDITATGIDNSVVGEYSVTVNAVDPTGNPANKTFTLSVVNFVPTSVVKSRYYDDVDTHDYRFTFTNPDNYEIYYWSNSIGGWKLIEDNTYHSGNPNPQLKFVDQYDNSYTVYYNDL